MLKKRLSLLLAALLVVNLAAWPVLAETQASKQDQAVEKVKARVAKLGVGEKALVTVKLKNGVELKGYIYRTGQDDFVIRDGKTQTDTSVAYRDVARIDSNRGHSHANAIALGTVAGVGAALAILLGMRLHNER